MTETTALLKLGSREERRRQAQHQLAEANRKFSEARALAPTGVAQAAERAREALVAARVAREELAKIDALEGVVRGRARR
jgi:hypothetical protein